MTKSEPIHMSKPQQVNEPGARRNPREESDPEYLRKPIY